jgi:hypothetical protein
MAPEVVIFFGSYLLYIGSFRVRFVGCESVKFLRSMLSQSQGKNEAKKKMIYGL